MAKKYIEDSILNKYRKFLNSPDTDFKKIYNNLSDSMIEIQNKKLAYFCMDILPSITNKSSLIINEKLACEHLEKMYFYLKDLYSIEDFSNKKNSFKKKQLMDNVHKSLDKFEVEIKFLFDYFETIIRVITLDFKSENTFNNSIRMMFEDNMMDYKEYNILKLFNKLRNLFTHNSNASGSLINNILDDIPLFLVIIEESKNIIHNFCSKFKIRIMYFTEMFANDMKILEGKEYNYMNLVYVLLENDSKMKINKLAFKDPSKFQVKLTQEFKDLTILYNNYIKIHLKMKKSNKDVTFEETIKEINVLLNIMLIEAKDKEEREEVLRLLSIKLNKEYLQDIDDSYISYKKFN